MNRACAIAFAVALACAASAAQAPAAAGNEALARQMLERARVALRDEPTLAKPVAQLDAARAELVLDPKQSLADAGAAFYAAVALDAPNDNPAGAAAMGKLKDNVEESAVQMELFYGSFDTALDWARHADVTRGPLYDWILTYSGAVGRGVELARECEAADGTFPYRGAAVALHMGWLKPPEDLLLVRAGYTAAGSTTSPEQMREALQELLPAGHEKFPQLDPVLETATASILQNLAKGGPLTPAAEQAAQGAMALLRQLDPTRAGELVAELPAAALPAPKPPPRSRFRPPPALWAAQQHPAEALAAASKIANPAERFESLVIAAGQLLRGHRERESLADAEAALDLQQKTPTLMPDRLSCDVILSRLLLQLGHAGEARSVLADALTARDPGLQALDAEFGATDSNQAKLAADLSAKMLVLGRGYGAIAVAQVPFGYEHLRGLTARLALPFLLTDLALTADPAARPATTRSFSSSTAVHSGTKPIAPGDQRP